MSVSSFYDQCFIEIPVFNENSVDPDQILHSGAYDLGLHNLPVNLLWNFSATICYFSVKIYVVVYTLLEILSETLKLIHRQFQREATAYCKIQVCHIYLVQKSAGKTICTKMLTLFFALPLLAKKKPLAKVQKVNA